MKSEYDRNREGLESVLKRVARSYAEGRITRSRFESFSKTTEKLFEQLAAMEEESGAKAEVHSTVE